MSSKVMVKQSKGVRVVGVISIIAGIIMIIAGGVTWWTVSDQLSAEKITVSEDASFLAGEPVEGPFTAYAQAEVINKHALELSDGMTYAQLEQDDPRREVVMNGSFLRASLFTSVVSFGVAALVIGLGVLFILVGWALNRLTRGTPIAAATAGGGGNTGAHSYDGVPSAPAPRHQSPPAASGPATGAPERTTTDRTATDRSAPGVNGVGTTSAAAGAVGAAGASAASRDSAPITNPGPPAAHPVEPASAPATAPAGTPVTAPGTVSGTPQETPGNPSPGTAPAGTPQETPGNPTPGTAPTGTPQETPGNPSPGTTPADERPAGWASPADRVPPVDETTDGNGTTK